MKNRIIKLLSLGCLASVMISCNEINYLKTEQYEKIVYTLGNSDFVYDVNLRMVDENSILGQIPVGLSGTLADKDDIEVTFEKDLESINMYNILNFGFEEEKYAKELKPEHYTIENPVAIIKAGAAVGTLPVTIKPLGLSPDSIYFIPLRISNVSKYKYMENRFRVLCRPRLENKYASEPKFTLYASDGVSQKVENGEFKGQEAMFSATKLVMPITHNKIRTTIHGNTDKRDETYLRKYSMFITIQEDNTLILEGCEPDLKLTPISEEGMNVYDEATKTFRLLYTYSDPLTHKIVGVKENLRLLTDLN